MAFELDKAATAQWAAAAERFPEDDPAARLIVACVRFRQWAVSQPRRFALVFANPIAEADSNRRELLTVSTSGHYFTDLLYRIWEIYQFPYPAVEDLALAFQAVRGTGGDDPVRLEQGWEATDQIHEVLIAHVRVRRRDSPNIRWW